MFSILDDELRLLFTIGIFAFVGIIVMFIYMIISYMLLDVEDEKASIIVYTVLRGLSFVIKISGVCLVYEIVVSLF